MIKLLSQNKYLILRRITQAGILLLFIGGNYWGWNILKGDLSTANFFDLFHLSDPYMVIQTFVAGYILANDVLLGALIILLFYAFIGGRSFCSWVCPMNIVTDVAVRIRKLLKLYQDDIKVPINRNFRYWILGLSIVVSAFAGIAAFELISPVSMLHRGLIYGMGFGWAAISVVFFFDIFVMQNGWCGYVCPLGGFYSLINRFSLFKVKHNHEACTACNKCLIVCPEKQVLLPYINKISIKIKGMECSNCGRCVDVCEDNALCFSLNNYKK